MDSQDTAGFSQPCSLCSDVNWGISEEGCFYCLSCYTAVERSREVQEGVHARGSSRISRLSKGPRTKRDGGGLSWRACEAFQFILKNQADALLQLGVSPGFKELVLWRMWKIYLQRSRLAFSRTAGGSGRVEGSEDRDSAGGSSMGSSGLWAWNLPSDGGSQPESSRDWSGSLDAASYLKMSHPMTMRRTLGLVHLALVWSRQALTLSDLLRLVLEGLVPYVKAYEQLPDQMRLMGKDLLLFRVEGVPPYRRVQQEAEDLARLLQLPRFPAVDWATPLHPSRLSLRYLTDANLPDQLHPWVCRLTERAGMAGRERHTFDPASRGVLPRYDLQAAALIIVTMKLLFGLDDHSEWDWSSRVRDGAEDAFHLRRWYRLVHSALVPARRGARRLAARTQWKAKKLVFRRRRDRHWASKKKRTADQVQACFQRLSSCPAGVQPPSPSSFRFCWGDQDASHGPSMHHTRLDGVLTLRTGVLTPSNCSYWHPALRPCSTRWCQPDHVLSEVEASLPESFCWLLRLFSFLLGVKPATLLQEVLCVERGLFSCRTPAFRGTEQTGTGTRTGTGTGT